MNCSSTSLQLSNIDKYLQSRRVDIEATLEQLLPSPPTCPSLIAQAMRYSLFAGGKRIRPILALAAADTIGGMNQKEIDNLVRPAACAVEMIHTYSLIHDDLPAMDDDTIRRGRPTAHVVYGEGIAILAGDGLLTEAFHVLTHWPESTDPIVMARKLRTTERISAASGVVGMVGGQTIDLQASGQIPLTDSAPVVKNVALDQNGLQAMHERKTGALIRAAAVSGSIMVGASDSEIEAIDGYAAKLGLGFQIIDDILDIEGEPDLLGKSTGKDVAAGKQTYPSVFGLEKSRVLAHQAIKEAKALLNEAGLGGKLNAIADWIIARTH